MGLNLLNLMWSGREARARHRNPGKLAPSIFPVEALELRWLPTPLADLTPAMVQGPDSAEPGGRISIQAKIDNAGDAVAGKFQIEYRLSLDGTVDTQDVLLATVTRKKLAAGSQAQWSQSVTLPANLPAGIYHLAIVIDPANRIAEAKDSNNSLVSSQTILVAATNLTGRVGYLKAHRPVEIVPLGDVGAQIDPTRTTWIVIHGRNQSAASPNVVELAHQLDRYQPGDQVLLLDWNRAAKSSSVGGEGENYIRPVASWAAQALTAYGFTGSQLNLVGYSWGAEIAAEMSEIIGQVNSMVAIDPARDYPGGSYNPEASGEVNFSAHANHSWAFFASSNALFGSAAVATTAENAFVVLNSDHFGIVSLVTNLIAVPGEGGIGSYLSVARLLTGEPEVDWLVNRYSPQGVLDLATGTFEAVLIAATNGTTLESLKFCDSEGEQTIPA